MPKLGMTGITLKEETAELLRKRTQEAGLGLNEFLNNLLKTPTINISEDTTQKIDNVISKHGDYQDRAEFVRDAIRRLLETKEKT